jgi:hypothetical protein
VVPMGYAKGLHKIGNFQIAIANLSVKERFDLNNLLLFLVAHSTTIKKHGLARVLCGVDSTGTRHDEPCLSSDLRALEEVSHALPTPQPSL